MKDSTKLLLVGCGKMGSALLQRLAGDVACTVIEPAGAPADLTRLGSITFLTSAEQMESSYKPDIILFAVKPQLIAQVASSYARLKNCAYLSIAAGITSAQIQKYLHNPQAAIIRCMPNLPASIGQGACGAFANEYVTPAQRTLCSNVLNSVGRVEWLPAEEMIDSVTALSGSGPAYVFALCEAIENAGVALGLAPQVAARLARQTIIGSGALLAQSTESVENLREAVTSPGGTTEAALKILTDPQALPELILQSMRSAQTRAKELADHG
jgi:pyrroline-5-carboxylate reductase